MPHTHLKSNKINRKWKKKSHQRENWCHIPVISLWNTRSRENGSIEKHVETVSKKQILSPWINTYKQREKTRLTFSKLYKWTSLWATKNTNNNLPHTGLVVSIELKLKYKKKLYFDIYSFLPAKITAKNLNRNCIRENVMIILHLQPTQNKPKK